MKISDLDIGDIVRAKCTAVGRYIGNGKVLFVSAMDSDLCVDDLKKPIERHKEAEWTLPLPTMSTVKYWIEKEEAKVPPPPRLTMKSLTLYAIKARTANHITATGFYESKHVAEEDFMTIPDGENGKEYYEIIEVEVVETGNVYSLDGVGKHRYDVRTTPISKEK